MAQRIRAHDWAATPLGPVARWSPGLRAVVDLMLDSPLVCCLALTEDRLLIYNDTAARAYSERHPTALGRPLRETFADSYPAVSAFYDRVFAGESVEVPAQPLRVGTGEVTEVFDAYLTPVRNADGAVIGAHMVGLEIGARRRAEAALHESEDRYRSLFDSMDQGFCVIEKIETPAGEPSDYRYVTTNPAFERHTGFVGIIGKSILQLIPNAETRIMDVYDEVQRSGEPRHFEDIVSSLDLWIDAEVFPASQPNQIAVLFSNVNPRKRAEAALQQSEERQTFLLDLGDALRAIVDPDAIQDVAAQLLGEHLKLDRCGYAEIDEDGQGVTIGGGYHGAGIAAFAGTHRLDAFGSTIEAAMRRGSTLAIDDIAENPLEADPLIAASFAGNGIRAFIATPLVEEGRLVAIMVGHLREPKAWTPSDIAVFEDVAERTWAAVERARGEAELRESRERLKLIVENAPDYAIFTIDLEARITDWREGAEKVFGYTRDEIMGRISDILYTPEDNAAGEPGKIRALAAISGRAPNVRWQMHKDGRQVFIDGVCTPLHDAEGNPIGFLKIGRDATERHEAEGRQRLLLGELQHRVRNILGMIRSIVRQSSVGRPDVEDYVNHLVGRIDAMARTQTILTRSPEARVNLEDLVRDELSAQVADALRLDIRGPEIDLWPKAAEVLTLALHELTTNSIKYGALSDRESRLSIKWERILEGTEIWLVITWQERSRKRWDAPLRPGFGTQLIEERVPYDLRGRASMTMSDTGMRAVIAFPLVERRSFLETGPAPEQEYA